MYLLSSRLPPSPWVGTSASDTAQYTVPSVSTQTVTPRRVGFLACSCAPPRAEPAGPSVWCTMMLRHGWALDTSPHGASQTIFRPAISGVPEARATPARSNVSADAGTGISTTQSAVASRRRFMVSPHPRVKSEGMPLRNMRLIARSRVLAQGRHCPGGNHRRQRWREVIDRIAVLAVFLGGVERVIGGSHQPVRERAHLPGPLRDTDRERDRDIRAHAGLGILAAHIQDAAGDHRALAQRRGGQHDAEFVAA